MALNKGANHSHQNKNQRQEHRIKMGEKAETKQTNKKNRTNKQGRKVEEMGKDELRGITSRIGDVLNSSILARVQGQVGP